MWVFFFFLLVTCWNFNLLLPSSEFIPGIVEIIQYVTSQKVCCNLRQKAATIKPPLTYLHKLFSIILAPQKPYPEDYFILRAKKKENKKKNLVFSNNTVRSQHIIMAGNP